jgi:hypothetical protein
MSGSIAIAPRDRHALLHAARQRVRKAIGEWRQVHHRNGVARLVACCRSGKAAARDERKHHVLGDRLPRQELVEFLEHHHPVRAGLRHGLAFEPDLAFDRHQVTRRSPLSSVDLPHPDGPKQHEAVAAEHFEVDAIRRRDEMVAGLVLAA